MISPLTEQTSCPILMQTCLPQKLNYCVGQRFNFPFFKLLHWNKYCAKVTFFMELCSNNNFKMLHLCSSEARDSCWGMFAEMSTSPQYLTSLIFFPLLPGDMKSPPMKQHSIDHQFNSLGKLRINRYFWEIFMLFPVASSICMFFWLAFEFVLMERLCKVPAITSDEEAVEVSTE